MTTRTKAEMHLAGMAAVVAVLAAGALVWTAGTQVEASGAAEDPITLPSPPTGEGGAAGAATSAGPVMMSDAYTLEVAAISSGGGGLADPGTGADRGFAVVGQTAPGVMTGPGYTFEVGIVPCLFSSIPSDFDGDGDVDLSDFARFQACFNGPNRAPAQAGCGAADADGDGDVDLADFAQFQACFNGPNRAPACE